MGSIKIVIGGSIIVGGIASITGWVLICMEISSLSDKYFDFKEKAMNCTLVCERRDDRNEYCNTECNNYGWKYYPYIVRRDKNYGSMLCLETATTHDYSLATIFEDPNILRKELANKGDKWASHYTYLILVPVFSIIFLVIEMLLVFCYIYNLSREDWRDYYVVFHIVFGGFYVSYYWLFIGSGLYLALGIEFDNCIRMKDPDDIDIMVNYSNLRIVLIIFGSIFPILWVLWMLGLLIVKNSNNQELSNLLNVFVVIYNTIAAIPTYALMFIALSLFVRTMNAKSTISFGYVPIYSLLVLPLPFLVLILSIYLLYISPREVTNYGRPPNPMIDIRIEMNISQGHSNIGATFQTPRPHYLEHPEYSQYSQYLQYPRYFPPIPQVTPPTPIRPVQIHRNQVNYIYNI